MIGMQYKHQELSGRSSSWHKAGRSSRFAESGVRTGSGATAPGRSPEQRGGEHFSLDLKIERESAPRMSLGKLFQRSGAR